MRYGNTHSFIHNIGKNMQSGTLSSELFHLKHLEYMDVGALNSSLLGSEDYVSGVIRRCLHALFFSWLQGRNRLVGTMPTSIGGLHALTHLDLCKLFLQNSMFCDQCEFSLRFFQ